MRKAIDFIMSFLEHGRRKLYWQGKPEMVISVVWISAIGMAVIEMTRKLCNALLCLINLVCPRANRRPHSLLGTLVPALAAISGNHHSSRKEPWETHMASGCVTVLVTVLAGASLY